METIRADAFTRKILVKAPPTKLYKAWTTAGGLQEWFLQEALFTTPDGTQRRQDEKVEAGDTYRWKWHNWEGEEVGKVLEANGRDRVSFTFSKSRLDIRLQPQGQRSLLVLQQHQLPEDPRSRLEIYHGCSNGWTFWLTNLKAWFEHGITLNETEADLRKDPMAAYEYVNI